MKIHQVYKLGRVIGRGHFGEVRVAEHRETHEKVAVKIVETHNKQDWDRVKHEVRVLEQLDHPNIAKLIACYEDEAPVLSCRALVWLKRCFGFEPAAATTATATRRLFIVTQLAQGGELFDRIVEKRFFNESEAREVTKTILTALQYLHRHAIVHRDLKPENIVFVDQTGDSRLQIVDFGASQLFHHDDPTKFTTTVGTPLYMSPEQLLTAGGGGANYGPEVDMWSTGVIVYILLSGTLPFQDHPISLMFHQILSGDYSFPEESWAGVSEHAIDFVRGCLTKDPAKRLTPAAALAHPWIQKHHVDFRFPHCNTDHLRYYVAKKRFQHVTVVLTALRHLHKASKNQQQQQQQLARLSHRSFSCRAVGSRHLNWLPHKERSL